MGDIDVVLNSLPSQCWMNIYVCIKIELVVIFKLIYSIYHSTFERPLHWALSYFFYYPKDLNLSSYLPLFRVEFLVFLLQSIDVRLEIEVLNDNALFSIWMLSPSDIFTKA